MNFWAITFAKVRLKGGKSIHKRMQIFGVSVKGRNVQIMLIIGAYAKLRKATNATNGSIRAGHCRYHAKRTRCGGLNER